jgi:hypothetical protein
MFASSACVQNESSLFVRGCMAVPRDTCELQASTTASFVGSGSIDGYLNGQGQYHCFALFENQLVKRGDPTTLRVETSRIELYQAEVQVLDTDPVNPTAYTKFTVPTTGFADPGTGTEPGLGIADVVLIDYATLKSLADTAAKTNAIQKVVASVVLHGRTLGGQELTSNEFKFPIDVCGGCGCAVPAGDVCIGSDSKPAADCLLGQDASVDCRALSPSVLRCAVNSLGQPDLGSATCPNSAPAGYVPCG